MIKYQSSRKKEELKKKKSRWKNEREIHPLGGHQSPGFDKRQLKYFPRYFIAAERWGQKEVEA